MEKKNKGNEFKDFKLESPLEELKMNKNLKYVEALKNKNDIGKEFKEEIRKRVELGGQKILIVSSNTSNVGKTELAEKIADLFVLFQEGLKKRKVKKKNYFNEEGRKKYFKQLKKRKDMTLLEDIEKDIKEANTGDVFIIPDLTFYPLHTLDRFNMNMINGSRIKDLSLIFAMNKQNLRYVTFLERSFCEVHYAGKHVAKGLHRGIIIKSHVSYFEGTHKPLKEELEIGKEVLKLVPLGHIIL